jgi:tRNA dimethylallyltransferase
MKKLLVILGPTACGKTSLAIRLAQRFNGEIISADSRQVYKEMDIITGKDKAGYAQIPVWGLDLVRPDEEFSAAHWLKFAQKVIKDIWSRKKLPIVTGGTGFWIKTLLEPVDSLGISPDPKLRKQLSNCSIVRLSNCLKKLDKGRWQRMNRSDRNNPRRLIRAIEIAKASNLPNLPNLPKANYLIIGLKTEKKFLYQRIDQRVDERVKQGAFEETEKLIKKGYDLHSPSMSSIGYQQSSDFFLKQKSKNEAIQAWKYSEHAYARRQLTFFKKMPAQGWSASGGKGINWFDIRQPSWQRNVVKLVKTWYIDNNAGKN